MKALVLPPEIPTRDEVLSQDPGYIWDLHDQHVPFKGCDFAITHVEGLDQSLQVELLFVYDPKSRSTIIDACLNGQRTLITRRKGLVVRQVWFLADGACDFAHVRLGPLR